MRITVLGTSPAWQNADGACSGYLVEDGATSVLVDCGSGVFAKLRGVRDYLGVDAVVITHMHADHFIDLVPFACALTYAPRQRREPLADASGADRPVRPRLFVPPGAGALLRTLLGLLGHRPGLVEDAFDVSEYDIAAAVAIDALDVRFQPVPHFVPTNAVDVRGGAGARVTFGADHGPTDALDAFAHATDLLVLEATLPAPESELPRGHLTPGEAGEHATRCGARRLLLTHLSDELDGDWALAAARAAFAGPVELARAGTGYEVSRPPAAA